MSAPTISVLLCVYNGADYLPQALDSVLGQTFSDWECVAVDDGSTDATPDILARYAKADARVRVWRNETNMGIPAARNRALSLAEGRYLACMDADDVSRSDRLQRQVAYMEERPKLALSCCRCLLWDGARALPGLDRRRGDPAAVKALFLFTNPIVQPGVIARAEAVKRLGYDPACTCTEDLDLWLRMLSAGNNLAVQKDYLVLYRRHAAQITARRTPEQEEQYRRVIDRFYRENLFPLGEEDGEFLSQGVYFRDRPDPRRLKALLRKVRKAAGGFDPNAVAYASMEVLLEYRRAGVPAGALAPLLLGLGPVFLAEEALRRRRAGVEDETLRREALERFAMEGVKIRRGEEDG